MSAELTAIIAVGIALAGLLIGGQRSLCQDVADVRRDIGKLRERMADIKGLLARISQTRVFRDGRICYNPLIDK